MILHRLAIARTLTLAVAAGAGWCLMARPAAAEAVILVEVDSGKVLHADNATHPWYPASVTKIMTAYATLRAVKERKITLDKLITVSHAAAAQSPVKMGFPPGTTVTVDNALKMLMVRSANDMAVVLAEGVAGSIEGFADVMNRHAQRLGMTQSNFVNPNGLPADAQVTSPRDMAMLARAVIKEFPEYDYYWHLPGIRMGKRVQRNYNTLIGRYPGADGMKTGFICASGFNLVATATRDGKRLIAVVMGAKSSAARSIKAAQLLERGFSPNPLSWLTPSFGSVEQLTPVDAAPPNLREEMCGKQRKRQATEDEDDSAAIASLSSNPAYSVFMSALRAPDGKTTLQQNAQLGEPVDVFTGPGKKAPEIRAADAKGDKAKSAGPAVASASSMPVTRGNPTAPSSKPAELAAKQGDFVPTPRARPKPIPSATAQTAHSTPRPAAPKQEKPKDAKKN